MPDVPLPAYAHVPGRTPHPRSDALGHRFGHDLAPPSPQPDDWPTSPHFLLGLDLFNGGYFWEAHELWEQLWLAVGRRGPAADFFKGLIQLAVAGVKVQQGRRDGVASHARRAAELFAQGRTALGGEAYLGLRWHDLLERAAELERDSACATLTPLAS